MLEEKTKEIKRTLRVGRDGRVMKFVHEVYLRTDIGCGWSQCELCSKSNIQYFEFQDNAFLFVPDYKSLNQYYDALMNCNLQNFLVTQTIAERMRKESRHLFKRFKSAVELERWRCIYVYPNEFSQQTALQNSQQYKPDDLDELHLFRTASYFSEHFMGNVKVVMISENQNLAKKSRLVKNLECFDIRQFVEKFAENPTQIMDFLGSNLMDNLSQIISNKELCYQHREYESEKVLLEKIMKGCAFQGKLKFGRFNKNEATVTSQVLNKEIVILGAGNLNRSIHGDKVVVELLDTSQWIGIEQHQLQKDEVVEENEKSTQMSSQIINSEIQALKQLLQTNNNLLPTGKVIGIVKRDLRNFCGELSAQINDYGLVSLTDSRYPDVIIQPRNLQAIQGKKIMISIDSWPTQSAYPLGHLIKILGDSENVEVENEVILFEFNVDTRDFSQRVLNCLPQQGYNWQIPEQEYQKRVDLRNEFICSVDPPGCRDIDDALHAKILPNGNIEAGVHIADVTHFVKPDTPIDQEAAERCTTVYLINKRTDMLPKLLTESLCSLVSDVERLAFSVVWEFDKNTLQIVNQKFHKSVIKSKKAFTYEQAYTAIQNEQDQSELTKGLRLLLKLSQNLKQKRIDAGALQLASTQVKFKMQEDDVNNPTDVSYYNLFPTNSMVEEFMLLANVSVAEKILEQFPSSSVLRRHSTPKPEHIKQLHKILKLEGFELDYTSSKTLANSLDEIKRKNDPFFNKLVRIMTTRCMHEAIYFCSADFNPQEYRHYGLAASVYTHFTSPIRRYADVLVHRLLSASLGIESLSPVLSTKSKLVRVCDQMNIKNRNARNASRASSEFYSYLFFKNKDIKEKAIIASIQSNGFSVVVAKYGFEGFLEFSQNDLLKNQQIFEENPDRALTDFYYKNNPYSLFEWLEVSIQVTLVQYRKKVDMTIIKKIDSPPEMEANSCRNLQSLVDEIQSLFQLQKNTLDFSQFQSTKMNEDFCQFLSRLFRELITQKKMQTQNQQNFTREMALMQKVMEKCYIFSTDIEYAVFYNKEIALRLGAILRDFEMDWDIQIEESQLIEFNAEKIFREIETKKLEYLKESEKEFSDFTKKEQNKEKQLEEYLKEINRLSQLMEENAMKNNVLENKIEQQKEQKKELKKLLQLEKENFAHNKNILMRFKSKMETEKKYQFEIIQNLQDQIKQKDLQIVDIKNENNSKQNYIIEIKLLQQKLQEDLIKVKSKLNDMKQQHIKMKQDQTQLNEKKVVESQINEVYQNQKSLQNSVVQIKQQLQQNEILQTQNDLNLRNDFLQNQLNEKEDIIKQLQKELENFRTSNNNQNTSKMLYGIDGLENENNLYDFKIKKSEEKQNQSQNVLLKISEQINDIVANKNSIQNDLNFEQMKLLQSVQEKFQEKIIENQKQIESQKQKIKKLKKQKQKHTKNEEDKKKMLFILENKIKFKNSQILQLNQLVSQYKDEKQFLIAKIKRLEQRFFDEFIEKNFKQKNKTKEKYKKLKSLRNKSIANDSTMKRSTFARIKNKRINTMIQQRNSINSCLLSRTQGSFKILPDYENFINQYHHQ